MSGGLVGFVRISRHNFGLLLVCFCILPLCVGCGSATKAEPVDLAPLVSDLAAKYEIVKAFYTGTAEEGVDGHDALHGVGSVLTKLSKLDTNSGLDPTKLADIVGAANKMMDTYGELDDAIHEGKEFEYDPLDKTLSECLNKIQTAASN